LSFNWNELNVVNWRLKFGKWKSCYPIYFNWTKLIIGSVCWCQMTLEMVPDQTAYVFVKEFEILKLIWDVLLDGVWLFLFLLLQDLISEFYHVF